MKIEGYMKMPVLEYWIILDSEIAKQKKAQANAAKAAAEQRRK